MDDAEIIIQRIVEPRTTIGGISVEDSAVINNRLTAIEAVSVPDNLDDLVPGAAANQVPVRQSDGTWQPRAHVTGISTLTDGTDTRSNVTKLIAGPGLDVAVGGAAGEGTLQAKFGGSGYSSAVAREDHVHSGTIPFRIPFEGGGALSGGVRMLVNQAVSVPVHDGYLVVELHVDMMNNVNAGNVRLDTLIGTTWTSRHRPVTTVGGVRGEWTARSEMLVGGATSYTVGAAVTYLSGDATNVIGGELIGEFHPRR